MQGEHGIPFDTLTNQAVIMRALVMIASTLGIGDPKTIEVLKQRIDYTERLCGSERIPGYWQPPEKS